MQNRAIKTLISLFMIIAIVIILLSARSTWRANNGDENEPTSQPGITASRRVNQTQVAETTSEPTETEPTTAAVLVPLPVNMPEPEPTPPTGMRRWPENLSIPLIREPDLQAYIGRSYDQQPLAGITIIIDPGHGGQDGGAQYPIGVGNPDYIEKEIVLEVSLILRDKLEKLGARVVMLRETDEWLSIYRRIAMTSRYLLLDFMETLPYHGYDASAIEHILPQLDAMIEINTDYASSGGRGPMLGVGAVEDMRLLMDIQVQYPDVLYLSIHCNALEDTRVGGLQVFYLTTEAAYEAENRNVAYQDSMANPPAYSLYPDEERLRLATLVRDSVLEDIPELKFAGERDLLEVNFAVLREMSLVSILLEMGFITNESDRAIINSPAGQETIAESVARAVYRYYCQP